MKHFRNLILVLFIAVSLSNCAAHLHTIGDGPKENTAVVQRQWYILYGLVPLNNVDTKTIAGNSTDYQIVTQVTAVDALITFFTSVISVNCRTVVVVK